MKIPQDRITNTILEIVRFRAKDKELILDSYALASKFGVDQKRIRDVFSILRKRLISFLPIKKQGRKGLYVLFEEDNPKHQELLSKYVRSNLKHMRTMYFNDVVKYLPIIKDEKLKTDIGQMYLALKGENNE